MREREKNGKTKGKAGISLAAVLLVVLLGAVTEWNGFFTGEDSQTVGYQTIYSETESAENLEFRSEKLLEEHYEKHGVEMGFSTPEAYENAAAEVVADKNALHKKEKEDGDDVYYLENTNEFVIVSTDGYIRTYFEPEDGIRYYERQ